MGQVTLTEGQGLGGILGPGPGCRGLNFTEFPILACPGPRAGFSRRPGGFQDAGQHAELETSPLAVSARARKQVAATE